MDKLLMLVRAVASFGILGSMGVLFWSIQEEDLKAGAICTVLFIGFAYLLLLTFR